MLRPLAAALLLALPAAATAQDVKPVDVRRLAFEYKCVFEEFQGKAESEFLQRLRRQREAFEKAKHKQLSEMEDLLAKALWARAKHFEGEKNLDQASALAGEMTKTLKNTSSASAGILDEADTLVINYSLARAETEESKNPGVAWKAYQDCTGTKKPEPLARAIAGLVRISKQRNDYEKILGEGMLEETLKMLDTVLLDLEGAFPKGTFDKVKHEDLDKVRSLRDRTAGGLGFVALAVVDFRLGGYKGASAPLDLKTATFSFTPVSEGKRWPITGDSAVVLKDKHALVIGTYDVRVYLAPAKDPVAVYLGVETGKKDAPTPIAVPAKIPEGMVYVGPWKDGGGFFIDRTEVTIGQVRSLAGGNEKLAEVIKESTSGGNSSEQWPAWFLFEESARAWESVTGKKIPSAKQWMDAAYGPRPAPYPWGAEAPQDGTHCAPKGDNPSPVGSFPRGRSPYGLDDMAGNVAEFVENGGLWVLGGHIGLRAEEIAGSPGKCWLRNPAPAKAAFGALPGAEQGDYSKYKVSDEDIHATGLRMVIVPGK